MKYDKEELTKSVEEQLKAGMSEKDILNRLTEAGLESIDARLLYIKAKHNVGGSEMKGFLKKHEKVISAIFIGIFLILVILHFISLLSGGDGRVPPYGGP